MDPRDDRGLGLLAPPDVPRERPGLVVADRMARQLECQLDLAVMVALVPQHELEHQDRVVVVEVHVPTCQHPPPHRIPHRQGTVGQHLRDAIAVTLDHPLFLRYVPRKLGSLLEDGHEPLMVDVHELLRDGRTALHRLDFQPTLGEGAQQVEHDGVVPVPGIQQSL